MLDHNMPLNRDVYARLQGLDPHKVTAEQEADFPRPFQHGEDED